MNDSITHSSFWMREAVGVLVLAGSCILISLTGCNSQKSTAQPATADSSSTASAVSVERGKYIVTTSACNDCHTPFKMGKQGPEPDMSRMLSGHPATVKLGTAPKLGNDWIMLVSATNTAFVGPWGTSYAANLTPDSATGIGTWTEQQFITAMRSGQFVGGKRPIMPPMPWNWIANLTDNDLKSVFAYLKSIPAISNAVPAYQPPATMAQAQGPAK